MEGAAAIGWMRFWVSEEVSARVASGVAQVLGEGNRAQSIGNGDAESGGSGAMVTHIVCLPAAYDRLREYEKMGVHLVTPLWAVRSAAQGRWHPEEGYSPDPAKFFSGLVVYFDDYPTNIKVVYGALVTHYGGQVSKQLTRFCSHAISDRPVENLLTALPALNEAPIQVFPLKWLDDCIGAKQLLADEPRIPPQPASNSQLSQSPSRQLCRDADTNHELKMMQLCKAYPGTSRALGGCAFVLALEYPRSTRSGLVDIIDRHGGRVFLTEQDACSSFAPSDVYFVCPFREAASRRVADPTVNVVSEFFVLMSVEARRRIDLDGGGKEEVHSLTAEEVFVQELCKPLQQWGPIAGFADCIICASGYNDDGPLTRQTLRRIIERLGGCYVGPLMMNRTTHLIVGDMTSEKLQRGRQWVEAGVPLRIVTLQWLRACLQSWECADESAFQCQPPEPEPKRELVVPTPTSIAAPPRSSTPSRPPAARTGADDNTAAAASDLFNSPLMPSQFQYDVDSIPTPEFPEPARTPQSQSRSNRSQKTPQSSKSSELGKRTREPLTSITNTETTPSPKRPATLNLEVEAHEQVPIELPEEAEVNPTAYRRFMLSAAGPEQKDEMAQIVRQLGAEISDTVGDYDDDCTHIILTELKRTPKFLFGCAGGKWILRPEYIEHCQQAGRWLPEEDFEWCAEPGAPDVDPKTNLWLGAPRTWRLAAATGQGPYSDMQIAVVGKTAPPRDQLERLVQVGRGSLTSIEDIVLPEGATSMRLVVAKEDHSSIHEALVLAQSTGCVLVKPTFLLDLVSMKQRPDPADPKYAVALASSS